LVLGSRRGLKPVSNASVDKDEAIHKRNIMLLSKTEAETTPTTVNFNTDRKCLARIAVSLEPRSVTLVLRN
jgi:hypothetical protein